MTQILAPSAVAGYSIHFSPQPLTASADAVVATITLALENTGTPVAINGQLKVWVPGYD